MRRRLHRYKPCCHHESLREVAILLTRDKSPQESTPAVDRRPTCLTHVLTNYFVHWTVAYCSDFSNNADVQSLRAEKRNFLVSFHSLGIILTHVGLGFHRYSQLLPQKTF